VKYSDTSEAKREVRVRYVVTPREMNVSDMRNALFNFLFAKSNEGGKLIIKVDDEVITLL
jgi:hypothetical protein